MRSIDWRIYYHDHGTWSDRDGPWVAAPRKGWICVVVRDPTETVGRLIHSWFAPPAVAGNNFYVCAPGEQPYATDDYEPFLDLPRTHYALVKFGHQTTEIRWRDIIKAAVHDPDFPRYSPRARLGRAGWDADARRFHAEWSK